MTKGWFVGSFTPTALPSAACEVAIKTYKAGDHEATHHHKIATEVTAVISGEVRMAGRLWGPGSIVTLEPSDASDFLALKDSVIVVVKIPSVLGDKYAGRAGE